MTFASPTYFSLLLLLIPLGIYAWYRHRNPATFTLSTTRSLSPQKHRWALLISILPNAFIVVSFILLVVALARPQGSFSSSSSTTEGIHIMLALDQSPSMLARDLSPNRITAARNVASEFVSKRPHDNIGIVAFSGNSYTLCPLTTDQATIQNLLTGVDVDMQSNGTAIGDGLATAIGRLKDIKEGSKVIILLTDGSNNTGKIAPLTAAEMAQLFGIRIYTVGVGSNGTAPMPVMTPLGIEYRPVQVDIDENTLTSIAQGTGGKYFRATDNTSLSEIYSEIDQLEKTKINVQVYQQRTEKFALFVGLSILFLLLGLLGRMTILRTLP